MIQTRQALAGIVTLPRGSWTSAWTRIECKWHGTWVADAADFKFACQCPLSEAGPQNGVVYGLSSATATGSVRRPQFA